MEGRQVFKIRSSNDGAFLSIEPAGPHAWFVRLEGPALAAEAKIYHERGDGIDAFFDSLARDWKGWDGSRTWTALEADLEIGATSDALGHVSLAVCLYVRGLVGRWRASGVLIIDAGGLARLADEAGRLSVTAR